MSDSLQVVLALWGAILATALGIIELLKHFRDKPRILVSADLSFRAATKEADAKGTLIETDHGLNEVLLALTAANHGKQPIQITACLVEEANGNLQQVIPPGLPALLEPNTQVRVEIQKEWLDNVNVVRLGVLDALGRVHSIDSSHVAHLVQRSNALPSNKCEYRNRETGDGVKAFQAKDKSILTKRPMG
ncbi:hypothetical protein KAT84_03735 [Candidatus Bipolaricaulota bacterium]|nr:hypothetical protein [Candidatus Bipolaricaulota bacterium]